MLIQLTIAISLSLIQIKGNQNHSSSFMKNITKSKIANCNSTHIQTKKDQDTYRFLDDQSLYKGSDDSLESSFSEPIVLRRRIKKKSTSKFQNGHWSLEEHLKYLEFMRNDFAHYSGQISNKVFKHMSNFILTRSAAQCRSHHQKFNSNLVRNHRFNRVLHDQHAELSNINEFQNTIEQPILLKYSDNEDIDYELDDFIL